MKKTENAQKCHTVTYVRVSTEEQSKNNSLPSQEAACKQLADELGLTVLKLFVDSASAKTTDRPQLQALLRFCEEHHKTIKAVVV
jgi:DNA invertase Pin-like site-specific DNA recombinase